MLLCASIPDTEKISWNPWQSLETANIGNMGPVQLAWIREEAERYYREGSIGILDACIQESEEMEGIVHVTDMTEQGQNVRILGLVGSPLYIALHLRQYEEAKQILERVPQTAEPGYAVRQFRVMFPSGKPEECEIEFLAGGVVYLEEILLTDTDLPDDLCIRLWHLFFHRNVEDRPGLFVEEEEVDGVHEVPLLIREWPCRLDSRMKFGDLQYIKNGWNWFMSERSREEYGPFWEAATTDLEQFFKGLKGLYRLKILDENLYKEQIDEMLASHLIVKSMHIILKFSRLEDFFLSGRSADPQTSRSVNQQNGVEQLLQAARKASSTSFKGPENKLLERLKAGEASDDGMVGHISQFKLAVDGAEALRKLKKGLEKLGFTYISGDTLWDACMDYRYNASRQSARGGVAFQIWKSLFDGELFLTMDGVRKSRNSQMLSVLLYDVEQPDSKNDQDRDYDYNLYSLRYLDGLRWSEGEGASWLEEKRHTAEMSILRENDRELLLLTLEKNVFLPDDIDFLWANCCEEEYLQLKPLLLLKKYGYL